MSHVDGFVKVLDLISPMPEYGVGGSYRVAPTPGATYIHSVEFQRKLQAINRAKEEPKQRLKYCSTGTALDFDVTPIISDYISPCIAQIKTPTFVECMLSFFL